MQRVISEFMDEVQKNERKKKSEIKSGIEIVRCFGF